MSFISLLDLILQCSPLQYVTNYRQSSILTALGLTMRCEGFGSLTLKLNKFVHKGVPAGGCLQAKRVAGIQEIKIQSCDE